MEFFENLGSGEQLTGYNIIGPLLLVALVIGAVAFRGISGSTRAAIREQFLFAFRRAWRFWWKLFMAPFVGSYKEIRAAYREFRQSGDSLEPWTAGLRDRAHRRTSGRTQSDSAQLIRHGRDSRDRP